MAPHRSRHLTPKAAILATGCLLAYFFPSPHGWTAAKGEGGPVPASPHNPPLRLAADFDRDSRLLVALASAPVESTGLVRPHLLPPVIRNRLVGLLPGAVWVEGPFGAIATIRYLHSKRARRAVLWFSTEEPLDERALQLRCDALGLVLRSGRCRGQKTYHLYPRQYRRRRVGYSVVALDEKLFLGCLGPITRNVGVKRLIHHVHTRLTGLDGTPRGPGDDTASEVALATEREATPGFHLWAARHFDGDLSPAVRVRILCLTVSPSPCGLVADVTMVAASVDDASIIEEQCGEARFARAFACTAGPESRLSVSRQGNRVTIHLVTTPRGFAAMLERHQELFAGLL